MASNNSTWKGIIVIIGSLLIQLTLGSVYIFGNFSTYIISYLRINGISPDIVYSSSIWISASGQISFGSMFLAGYLERRLGPRITTFIGSCIFSVSMLLSYFSVQYSFPCLVFTYGFLHHIGVSIGYPVGINCAMRWFPNNKGTVVGIVIGGFGFAAFVWNPLVTLYINPKNYTPNHKVGNEVYFSEPEILNKVPSYFLVSGICYVVASLLGTLMTFNPKPSTDYEPVPQKEYSYEADLDSNSEFDINQAENKDEQQLIKKRRKTVNSRIEENTEFYLTPREVLKTPQFYLLWFILLFFNQSIDFIIVLYKAYGQTFIKNDKFLSMTGAFASIANAFGRPMWGLISDKISLKKTLFILILILASLISTLGFTENGGKYLFAGYIFCIYLTFSGMFSLLPLIIQNLFGTKHFITNYGLLFTVFIFNGVFGSYATIELKNKLGWHTMFYILGCVLLIAAISTCFFKQVNLSTERSSKIINESKNARD